MRLPSAVWLLLILAMTSPAWSLPAWAGEDVDCDLPSDLLVPSAPMPHVAKALARGQISILAVGSGSTVGDTGGANGPEMAYRAPGASFPFRMADALRMMRPGLDVRLTVKGGRSMTADDMLPILRNELKHGHFNVVLWQTGTVEAVHGVRPDSLRDDLLDGAAMADAAEADLVLVDAQFSRFLRANADLSPYEAVLRQVSGMNGVALFPRFDLTQGWVNSGQIDLERVSREARDHTVMLLNTCLGRALAQFLIAGAQQH
ncbi:MAG TPA: hypothetical protein VE690_02230 [Rhodopila sp.]|nr:hypothetical protein [Rhodopila sp.]